VGLVGSYDKHLQMYLNVDCISGTLLFISGHACLSLPRFRSLQLCWARFQPVEKMLRLCSSDHKMNHDISSDTWSDDRATLSSGPWCTPELSQANVAVIIIFCSVGWCFVQ
jgi:hypothetical protein